MTDRELLAQCYDTMRILYIPDAPLLQALKARLEQPEHVTNGTPCWCNPDVIEEEGGNVIVHNYEDNWQQYAKPGETAQQCIERHRAEQDALLAIMKKPEPEPVAVVTGVYGGRFVVEPINASMVLPVHMALYTAPPQREWQGLTDEEIYALWEHSEVIGGDESFRESYYVIEAKLKEKNNA